MQTIEMVRLIADEGKELVKGDLRASCVDTFADKASEWTEVAIETDEESDETTEATEATDSAEESVTTETTTEEAE